MRAAFLCLLSLLALPSTVLAQGTVPVFTRTVGSASYSFAGGDPAQGHVTTIPTVLVPVTLSFEAKHVAGRSFVMNADADVPRVVRSPIFSKAAFGAGGETQYIDAMMRATFPGAKGWRTLLGRPEVKPVKITVPAGYGYVLTSKRSGTIAIVDLEFLQKELFKRLPKQDGKLVIAVTHNTAYYALGDATVCCSWGTHGVDRATGNSFVLGSYLRGAPAIVTDRDVQPLSQQLAEFFYDPVRDPLVTTPLFQQSTAARGNVVPRWMRPVSLRAGEEGSCGGSGVGSMYFLLEPTDVNHKNNFPASPGFQVRMKSETYHVQNVALLQWYVGGDASLGGDFSFPDRKALVAAATPCPVFRMGERPSSAAAVEPVQPSGAPNGHQLIGYWTGHGVGGAPFALRDVSPQWDVVIVAFATPDKDSAGTLYFRLPRGIDPAQFKADVVYLKSKGRKVMISLGGGGKFFTMPDAESTQRFLASVTSIISEYGFDGIDLDFESPSLVIDPGDTDFRHPTTPSIVNMIAALRHLREHFGPGFMISLVPEGTQIPAGYPAYGGQFGSYLPIAYAVRDILSFVDVQDYNTPPLQGLDGEIYQTGSVDYHAAMTELLLRGFNVGGSPRHFFPGLPARQVAVGFLTGYSTPKEVSEAMEYIITGKAPAGASYKLRKAGGYPEMIGAMFWTIDADLWGGYNYSNVIGPQLHGYPAGR
ncbi:glycosyl hydrolase family 18 protein [Edaphobacter sp.]|uniref:glycosyl hydrolase family 18 protein n=1 Tax=Edaphobacter sp. TaxID=1934404 RepID=UPI002DB8E47B|nr:glycosyl hydrolase family 18 protein [Edaphobacter sp.]HEU5342233.1 glycosyl hydrolase family 18 protein [Edaphobacter sp.]